MKLGDYMETHVVPQLPGPLLLLNPSLNTFEKHTIIKRKLYGFFTALNFPMWFLVKIYILFS
jgi:hypothetical protein